MTFSNLFRSLLTKRIIKLLDEQSKKDEEGYLTWYNAFHLFLKEGMATDQENAEQILQLLRYQANFTEKQINIEDYLKQMKTGQNKIYYILGPNKEACERSPYMEPFKGTGNVFFEQPLISRYPCPLCLPPCR